MKDMKLFDRICWDKGVHYAGSEVKMKLFDANSQAQKETSISKKVILNVGFRNDGKAYVIAEPANSFFLEDLCGILEEADINCQIVNIVNFNVEQSLKHNLLNNFCSQFDESTLIITVAYISAEEFPETEYYLYDEEPNKKKIPVTEVLQRECKLLEDIGFINVNKYVKYEYKDAYIYGNKIGQRVSDIMLKSV